MGVKVKVDQVRSRVSGQTLEILLVCPTHEDAVILSKHWTTAAAQGKTRITMSPGDGMDDIVIEPQ